MENKIVQVVLVLFGFCLGGILPILFSDCTCFQKLGFLFFLVHIADFHVVSLKKKQLLNWCFLILQEIKEEFFFFLKKQGFIILLLEETVIVTQKVIYMQMISLKRQLENNLNPTVFFFFKDRITPTFPKDPSVGWANKLSALALGCFATRYQDLLSILAKIILQPVRLKPASAEGKPYPGIREYFLPLRYFEPIQFGFFFGIFVDALKVGS